MWPWTMTLTLDFQGQILKKPYPRNGITDWHEMKRMWVDRKSDPLCDFRLWSDPWPWSLILMVRLWKSCISGVKGSIDIEQKGPVNSMLDPLLWPWVKTLTLDCQDQILKKLYPSSRVANWHGRKRMWVNKKFDQLYDFELWHHPWTWLWIFNVKSCISGRGGSIYMDLKGCESTGCWTQYVTLSYDLELGLSRSNGEIAVSQEREGQLTWSKGMGVDGLLDTQCDLDLYPYPWPWNWIFKFHVAKSQEWED